VKRKLIEWTIFAVVATGAVFFVHWFVPWAVLRYYHATARPLRLDPALRKRLRQAEDKLSANQPAVSPGPKDFFPCLVVPAPVGVGPARSTWAEEPIQDCLQIVPGDPPANAFEVLLLNGGPMLVQTDMYLPGNPPIAFTRIVEAPMNWNRKFQVFLPNVYDTFPFGDRYPYTYQKLQFGDRMYVLFQRISKGTGYADAIYEQKRTRGAFDHALEGWNGEGWDLDLADGRTLVFPEAYNSRRPQQGALVGLIEPSGASLSLHRDRDGNLQTVHASDGGWLKIAYEGALTKSLEDSAGKKSTYRYDGKNFLAESTNAAGETFIYSYNQRDELSAVQNEKTRQPVIEVGYNSDGSVASLRISHGPGFYLSYQASPGDPYPEIDVRNDQGKSWVVHVFSCTENGCEYNARPR
jgi:YD repeat-containing protein